MSTVACIVLAVVLFVGLLAFFLIPPTWPCHGLGKDCKTCGPCGEGGRQPDCIWCRGSMCQKHPGGF